MLPGSVVIRIEGYPDFTLTNSTVEMEIPALRDMGIRGTVQVIPADQPIRLPAHIPIKETGECSPACIHETTK